MSTLAVGTIKSVSSAAPVFQNTSGTEIGQLVFAWVTVDPSGSSSVADSFNISSVTEIDDHSWRINFARAASNSDYATAVDVEADSRITTNTRTTSNFRADTDVNLTSSNQRFFIIVCGN